MPRSRTAKGRGEVEKLPTGRFRARVTATVVVAGEKARARASKTFATRREAWDWLDEQGRGSVAPSALTVGQWLARWLELHRPEVAARSYAGDAHVVGHRLVPALGPVRLRDLDGLAVSRWLANLKAAGVSDSERQKAGACLRKSLHAAVRYKVLATHPMTGVVKLPTPRRAEKVVMTAAEAGAVVQAADARGIGYAVRLWLDAGLRPAEMFALDWDDLDFAAGAVTVRKALDGTTNEVKQAKTAKSRRTIPLAASTLAACRAARPSAGGVFLPNASGGHWWASNFAGSVGQPLMTEAGMAGKGFDRYTFRHTMASLLLSAGVSILVVSRRLGHAKVSMTLDVYSHLLPDDAAKAATAMGELLPPLAP